ncbi:MAG: hypothetical protein CJBNEKGG_03884 [Prosthecobacter sp.]|nr:hypothetical protein [Prosthecobacter sp.]
MDTNELLRRPLRASKPTQPKGIGDTSLLFAHLAFGLHRHQSPHSRKALETTCCTLCGRPLKSGIKAHTAERHWRRMQVKIAVGNPPGGIKAHTAERHWRHSETVPLVVFATQWHQSPHSRKALETRPQRRTPSYHSYLASKPTQPKGIGDPDLSLELRQQVPEASKPTQPKGIGDIAGNESCVGSTRTRASKPTQPKGIGDLLIS